MIGKSRFKSLVFWGGLFCALLAFWNAFSFFSNAAIVIDSSGGWSSSTNFNQLDMSGQAITGQSTSTNFILQAGFAYFGKKNFIPSSQNWRWFGDEGNETPIDPLAGENVVPFDLADQDMIKLRITVKDIGGEGGKNIKFRLQFSEYSDFSNEIMDVTEISSCVIDSLWCYADGGGIDNEIINVKLLSDADACSGGVGNGCGTRNESGISLSSYDQKKDVAAEYEFVLKNAGALLGATYFFRLVNVADDKPVAANVGETYPAVIVKLPILTFTVDGLPAGIATEGVVTNVSTTSRGIEFGDLGVNIEKKAAQRLTIDSNGKQGYQIFILQRQGLVGNGEIASVTADNEYPAAWVIPPEAAGAYGYHTGDDVLAGNSMRFAPNNTYARLENVPKEIGFSSTAVNNEVVDVVFKAEVTDRQVAGLYSGAIVYIVVPNF